MAQFDLDCEGRELWQRLRAGRRVEAQAAMFANTESAPLGLTLLHVAVRRGDEENAARLLAAGARVDAVTEDGDTPLMDAARHSDLPCLKLLLDAGASVSAVNKHGHSALFAAVLRETLIFPASSVTRTTQARDAVQLLLRAGADPNVGGSPLYIAANGGLLKTTKLLLAAGADPNARYELAGSPSRGWAPTVAASVLDGAARAPWFSEQIVAALLLRGARPCGADLHAAIRAHPHSNRVLLMLLVAGAPLEGESSIAYSFTQTMFSDEAGEVHNEVVRMAVSPLDYALVTGRVTAAEELLAWGAKAFHPDALVVLRNSPEVAAEALRLIDARETSLRLAGPINLRLREKTFAFKATAQDRDVRFDVLVQQMVCDAAQAAYANRLADEFFARGVEGLAQELCRAKPAAALALSAVRIAKCSVLREYASLRNAAADEIERRVAEQLARLPAARAYAASFL